MHQRQTMRLCPHVHLHPEMPGVALLGLAHLGVAGLFGILSGGRGLDDGRVHDRAPAQHQPALSEQRSDLGEHRLGQPVLLEQVPEVQNRGLIGCPVVGQIQPRERAHRGRVVERLFHRRIRQVEPLLHEVDPQHPLQGHHRPAALTLRVVRLHQRAQLRPRHHPLHFDQELLAPCRLLLVRKGQRCKRHLLHSNPPFVTRCFNLAARRMNARINSELP
jgi:hypothetical protein